MADSVPCSLPAPLQEAMRILVEHHPDACLDAVQENWAYVWVPGIELDAEKFPAPHRREGWVRVPIQFPAAVPWGLVTKEPLLGLNGRKLKGDAGNHDYCGPVRSLGGQCYYSWTWNGELGNGPTLCQPKDILVVVAWLSRRANNA